MMLQLPFLGHRMHRRHDLIARAGCTGIIVCEADRILRSTDVLANHAGEVALDESKMCQVVKRRPVVRRVMFTWGEITEQLRLGYLSIGV